MIYEMVSWMLPPAGHNPNAVTAPNIFGRPTPLQHHCPDVLPCGYDRRDPLPENAHR